MSSAYVNNPEVIEDRRTLYVHQTAAGATTPTAQTYRLTEEKDEESHPGFVPAPTTATTTTTTTTISAPAPTTINPVIGINVKQNVRPAPQPETVYAKPVTTATQNVLVYTPIESFFVPYAALLYFALLVLVTAAYGLTRGQPTNAQFLQYELTTGQIGFALAFAALVIDRIGTSVHHPVRVALAAFLLFLWVPTLVIATFFGSFTSPLVTAPGFFGCWGAVIVSALVFAREVRNSTSWNDYNNTNTNTMSNVPDENGNYPRSRRSTYGPISSGPIASAVLLLFTSLMVMGAGIQLRNGDDNNNGDNNNNNGNNNGDDSNGNNADDDPVGYVSWAIAFGAAAAFFSLLFLLFVRFLGRTIVELYGVLLWIFVTGGALVLTFGDPFRRALGNGYYACLFSMVASCGLLMYSRRKTKPEDDTVEAHAARSFFFFMRIVAFASIVVMIAGILLCTNDNCDNARRRYEIAAGAVPLALTLPIVLLEFCGLYRVNSWFKVFYALLVLLWWIAAFIVVTYFGSYQSPVNVNLGAYANGYFFSWVGLIASALAFAEAIKERSAITQRPNRFTSRVGYLFLVIIGSAVELGAAIQWYYRSDVSAPLVRFALAAGGCSILLCLLLIFILPCFRHDNEQHDRVYKAGLYFLVLWWLVATLVLTLCQDFWYLGIDNGYFGTNFALFASLLALSLVWRREEKIVQTTNTTQ